MRQAPVTLTADTAGTPISTVIRRHDADYYSGTVFFGGDFGGGTVSLQFSIDGGATLFVVNDIDGNAISATSAEYANFIFYGDGNTNPADENINLYVFLTGSSAPALVCTLFDNR